MMCRNAMTAMSCVSVIRLASCHYFLNALNNAFMTPPYPPSRTTPPCTTHLLPRDHNLPGSGYHLPNTLMSVDQSYKTMTFQFSLFHGVSCLPYCVFLMMMRPFAMITVRRSIMMIGASWCILIL
jgi:hypothetical protein